MTAILLSLVPGAGVGTSTSALAPETRIVGYYTSWSVYDPDYHVPDIPAERISHINYAFAKIADGRIALGDPYADIDKYYPGDSWDPDSLRGGFHQLLILKENHPHLKTLISVGGWTWSTFFSDVALTEESRAVFASSCVDFVIRYGFDGIDIDWEYPVSGGLPDNIYRPEDKRNYTLLLEEVRNRLDTAGDYILTIAGPAMPSLMENIEIDQIHQYLDWINVMTYDFHGPWDGDADPVTNFNSALHAASEDPLGEPFHSMFNLEAAIAAYLERGVPSEELSAGLAFYGNGYGEVEEDQNGLFVGYAGPCEAGTWESGIFDFWDLAEHYVGMNGYSTYWHDESKVPWLFNATVGVMISYDDPRSIAEKARFALTSHLGGVMFWEFSADKHAVLLDAAYAVLGDTSATGIAETASTGNDADLMLGRSYPNPFASVTVVPFHLNGQSHVTIRIFDVAGRRVRTLLDAGLPAGEHSISWNGLDDTGTALGSGVYLYVIDSGSLSGTGRMIIVE